MAVVKEEPRLQEIAKLLVQANILDKRKILAHQSIAHQFKQPLLQYLVINNIVNEQKLALIIAQDIGVPLMDLDCIDKTKMPLSLVNEKLIRRHAIIPLYKRGHHLFLAIDEPCKLASFKEIQFHTGLYVSAIVVETTKLTKFINTLLNKNDKQLINSFEDSPAKIRVTENELTFEAATDNDPIVKFVNEILNDAIKKGSSDIHFEPYEEQYRIRYRLDGILVEAATPPVSLANRIASRLKVMANLDISERRVPQDGRFKLTTAKNQAIDFRVNTCPTTGGEKVVMRVLPSDVAKSSVETLGFNPIQEKMFLSAIKKPQGMILVTGPTGSGKSVSLYTALNILNTHEVNILTAEDPVEIKIPGINQVNINSKTGLTFSNALRSFLRQDPDIIMLGEIRDHETAEIAVKAAQTGHLVLSTLHTNSAAETLTRLSNMGIPPFNIASSISLLVAQRLVRKLCDECKIVRDDITLQLLDELNLSKEDALYKAVGCNHCTNGYKGRIGLFEVMPMTKTLGQLIMSHTNSLAILKQAQDEGMITIYQAGLEKVKQGVTSIEELNRVTVE